MRHRHLDYDQATPPAALGLAALDDVLERGDLDDWRPLLQAIGRDPWGELAGRVLHLLEHRPPSETATLWHDWIERRRAAQEHPPRLDAPAPAGRALRELRLRRGLTQQQLASRLGTVQPEISKLERRADVRLSSLRAYVGALGGRLRLTARFPGEDVELD